MATIRLLKNGKFKWILFKTFRTNQVNAENAHQPPYSNTGYLQIDTVHFEALAV